jgi:hypothetical protein
MMLHAGSMTTTIASTAKRAASHQCLERFGTHVVKG